MNEKLDIDANATKRTANAVRDDHGDPRKKEETDRPLCGLIMPISDVEGYPANHWNEVRSIIEEAVQSAGFSPRMVSEADETTVIHATIVENLYAAPIAVCDISSRRPNVFFELGMRLTFDKPVVIVKDDKTKIDFDIGPIEFLPYTAALHYSDIRRFTNVLAAKLENTHRRANEDPQFSPFLKHFGHFVAKSLKTTEVPPETIAILKQIEALRRDVQVIPHRVDNHRNEQAYIKSVGSTSPPPLLTFPLEAKYSAIDVDRLKDRITQGPWVGSVEASLEGELWKFSVRPTLDAPVNWVMSVLRSVDEFGFEFPLAKRSEP